LAIDGAMILMVAELAQLAGVHPTHLLKTFRRHHGVTISNYVRQRRIQRARLAVDDRT
jgi:AraC family transcriptional regulator